MEEEHTISFKYLSNIKDHELKPIFEDYIKHAKLYAWLRLPLLLLTLGILSYNFFIAGNRYTYAEYDNIMTIVFSALGFICIMLLVIYIIILKRATRLKSKIKNLSLKHNFAYSELLKEINIYLKSVFGGHGI